MAALPRARIWIALALSAAAPLVLAACGNGARAAPHTAHAAGVPASFEPRAFSALGARTFWLLGTVPCRGGKCVGLVATTDGGLHFRRLAAPPLKLGPYQPQLQFVTRRDGYAVVRWPVGQAFATHDGGASWHRLRGTVLAFAATGDKAYAVAAHCAGDRCAGYRLRRLSSSGWSSSPLPITPDSPLVGLAASGPRVWLLAATAAAYGGHDRILRSGDDGRTFTAGTGPCYADLGGVLAPAGAGVVWAVCPTGMQAMALRSVDGGVSFQPLHTPALVNSAQLAAVSADTAVLFGNGAGSRLWRTTDGGATWKAARSPSRVPYVDSIAFTGQRDGFALVQADPSGRLALWRTVDAGASWSNVRLG